MVRAAAGNLPATQLFTPAGTISPRSRSTCLVRADHAPHEARTQVSPRKYLAEEIEDRRGRHVSSSSMEASSGEGQVVGSEPSDLRTRMGRMGSVTVHACVAALCATAVLGMEAACTNRNPDYCDSDRDCTLKDSPYCDAEGAIASPHTCIACPVTGCPTDAAINDASVDAPADATVPALGLGKVCESASCPVSAGACLQVLGAGTKFCTLTCGTTATAGAPPTGGDEICVQAMPPPGAGTPECAIFGPDGSGMVIWYCAIRCGNDGSTVYGGCPLGLVCSFEHYCN